MIILGSGRSGTSMVAGLLAGASYNMGRRHIEPNEANPKGYFEDKEINDLNEAILDRYCKTRPEFLRFLFNHLPLAMDGFRNSVPIRGRGQLWLARIPQDITVEPLNQVEKRLQTLLSQRPFCFKDPRFCYTIPAWRPYLDLDETVFLCVFRNPADTVESVLNVCRKSRYLNNIRIGVADVCEMWRSMYAHVLHRHKNHGRWMFIRYEQAFENGFSERLSEFTGAKVDSSFATKTLHRSHGNCSIDDATLSTYADLCRLAEDTPS